MSGSLSMDAPAPSDGEVLSTDVCIVGAGPAGITIALGLARKGIRVTLLEGGGRSIDRAGQAFARGDSSGDSYFPLETTRGAGFGGTSQLWLPGLFRTAPLTALDFEARAGIPYSGWPITRAELDPFYSVAAEWCGIGDLDPDVRRWASPERPALDLANSPVESIVFQSADRRTWVRRFDEVAGTAGLRLLLHARVTELCASEDGSRIDRIRVRAPGGAAFEVRPRVSVLAAGGIENARLLLLSRGLRPHGIGNEEGLVGRFFQEHLALRGGILRFDDPAARRRMGLYSMHSSSRGVTGQAKLTLSESFLREKNLLGSAFFVTRTSEGFASQTGRSLAMLKRGMTWRPRPGGILSHAGILARSTPTLARIFADRVLDRSGDTLQLLSEAEQAPNPESRVILGERLDPLGYPRAQLIWRTTELDRRSIVEAQAAIDRALRRAGVGWLEQAVDMERPRTGFAGHWHHMGTTRMHDSPKVGVVDRHARVHRISNLYMAGSSVFPTSGYANPMLTIVALALRLSQRIEVELRQGL